MNTHPFLTDFNKRLIQRDGTILRKCDGKPRKVFYSQSSNCLHVKWSEDGEQINMPVRRLVALVYLPNPDNLPYVRHKDGNPMNCHVDNLYWASVSEMMQNARLNKPIGNEHWNHKLTLEEVTVIKTYPMDYSRKDLAEEYGVKPKTISDIFTNKTWKHVPWNN